MATPPSAAVEPVGPVGPVGPVEPPPCLLALPAPRSDRVGADRPAGRRASWVARHLYPRCTWQTVRGYPDEPGDAVELPATAYLAGDDETPFPLFRLWLPAPGGTGFFCRLAAVVPPGTAPRAAFYPTYGEAGTPYYQPLLAVQRNTAGWWLVVVRPLRWRLLVPLARPLRARLRAAA